MDNPLIYNLSCGKSLPEVSLAIIVFNNSHLHQINFKIIVRYLVNNN